MKALNIYRSPDVFFPLSGYPCEAAIAMRSLEDDQNGGGDPGIWSGGAARRSVRRSKKKSLDINRSAIRIERSWYVVINTYMHSYIGADWYKKVGIFIICRRARWVRSPYRATAVRPAKLAAALFDDSRRWQHHQRNRRRRIARRLFETLFLSAWNIHKTDRSRPIGWLTTGRLWPFRSSTAEKAL